MSPEDFHDHNKWQDLHYRKPTGGEFKQTHVFTIKYTGGEGGGSTVILKQDDNDADVRLDNLMPTRRSRDARLLNTTLGRHELKPSPTWNTIYCS